jgi:hypothetical protein
MDVRERENRIQSGVSYSEMIPLEYEPSGRYMKLFNDALAHFSGDTAMAVSLVASKIMRQYPQGTALVSLARAGTPIGILVKRYIAGYFGIDIPHYSISIVRGKGIDHNALAFIRERHFLKEIVFIDGWTGKGAIASELREALEGFSEVAPQLAVLSDPARVAGISGTYEDILIPSACLNATVSGLISRTFHRSDIIGESDFHGAVYYEEQAANDLSYHFVEAVEKHFVPPGDVPKPDARGGMNAEKKGDKKTGAFESARTVRMPCDIKRVMVDFGIENINFIKPGIGEATRVLLRRLPWKVLVRDKALPEVRLILRLAEERGVVVTEYPLRDYKACGLIRAIGCAT